MSPAVGPGKGPSRMNRNVLLAFIFWFLSGSSAGLTIGPAMTAYIYFVTNGSTMHVRDTLLLASVDIISSRLHVVC